MPALVRRGCVFALAVAVGACAGPADPALEVVSPLERQVFQRDASDAAEIPVIVSTSRSVAGLRIRVRLADGTALPWTVPDVASDPSRQTVRWTATLRVPAGGWHAVQLVTSPDDRPVTAVARFGVGEVFVVAGQSNATNWGERDAASDPPVNDRVSAFDGHAWTLARDPMPGVQDGSLGGSPWPRFGDRLEHELDVPVGVSAVGHGNTSILDWRPGAPPRPDGPGKPLYPALRDRVDRLGTVRAILWHQGERDVWERRDADAYVAAFLRLRDGLRDDTGCPAPWMVAGASFEPGADDAAMRTVREAQARLWTELGVLRGPDTDVLRGPLRARDGVHFSERGLEEHARLWYERVRDALFDAAPERGTGPAQSVAPR